MQITFSIRSRFHNLGKFDIWLVSESTLSFLYLGLKTRQYFYLFSLSIFFYSFVKDSRLFIFIQIFIFTWFQGYWGMKQVSNLIKVLNNVLKLFARAWMYYIQQISLFILTKIMPMKNNSLILLFSLFNGCLKFNNKYKG